MKDDIVLFNQSLLNQLNLSKKQINESIKIPKKEIKEIIICVIDNIKN